MMSPEIFKFISGEIKRHSTLLLELFWPFKNTPSPPPHQMFQSAAPQKNFGKKEAPGPWLSKTVFKTDVTCLVLPQFEFQ